jgi:hypothetical protein
MGFVSFPLQRLVINAVDQRDVLGGLARDFAHGSKMAERLKGFSRIRKPILIAIL